MRIAFPILCLALTGCCGMREAHRPACLPERPTLVQRIKSVRLPWRRPPLPAQADAGVTVVEPAPVVVTPKAD